MTVKEVINLLSRFMKKHFQYDFRQINSSLTHDLVLLLGAKVIEKLITHLGEY